MDGGRIELPTSALRMPSSRITRWRTTSLRDSLLAFFLAKSTFPVLLRAMLVYGVSTNLPPNAPPE